jgi:anthranilate phosphoribosyltransferase
VADAGLLPVIVEVLRTRGVNALVVRGDDGLDKVSTVAPSQVWRVHGGRARHEVLDPRALGIPRPGEGELRGGSVATNARVVRTLLAGQPGPVRDAVLLNAAAAMARCAEAIDSGAAADRLTRWVSVAQARRADPR